MRIPKRSRRISGAANVPELVECAGYRDRVQRRRDRAGHGVADRRDGGLDHHRRHARYAHRYGRNASRIVFIVDFLFGPMWFTRLDLAAIGIMRGRDNGVPRYNEVRRSFGLPPRNWSEINPERFQKEPEVASH